MKEAGVDVDPELVIHGDYSRKRRIRSGKNIVGQTGNSDFCK